MKYYMLYLKTKNVNLVKDMGMIPYKLHKLFQYDAVVATYNNDDYTYQNDEVKGLKIDFVEKKYHNYSLDGIRYLKKKAKEIDILQIFHVTISSVFYAFAYKLFNPSGKVYIKLDCTHELTDKIKKANFFTNKMVNIFFNKTDLISVEQMQLYHKLKDLLPEQKNKIIHLPNGLDYEYIRKANLQYDFNSKENIILNVARIGTPEKNTEMLLEAFSKVKDIVDSPWKLVMVGPIEKEFHSYLEKYIKQNPELRDKVIFKGIIDDRTKLFEEYSRAKIFCLTSNFESFGFVFIEAAAFGDVIVSTDVGIARELITEGNGRIVKVGDVEALSNSLYEIMNDKLMGKYADKTYNICKSMFNWDDIIIKLNSYIIELFKNDKR